MYAAKIAPNYIDCIERRLCQKLFDNGDNIRHVPNVVSIKRHGIFRTHTKKGNGLNKEST